MPTITKEEIEGCVELFVCRNSINAELARTAYMHIIMYDSSIKHGEVLGAVERQARKLSETADIGRISAILASWASRHPSNYNDRNYISICPYGCEYFDYAQFIKPLRLRRAANAYAYSR